MITVIGAGLSGCEAANVIAKAGEKVKLIDMKPNKLTAAHKKVGFAELVCSNSLRSDRLQNASGLLKAELRLLDSLIMKAADSSAVPAGGALAVNRDEFSDYITESIRSNSNIEVISEIVERVPEATIENPVIIATGPLTDGALLTSISEMLGEPLHFFDAAAPIVTAESIDLSKAFSGSRYDRGDDYINCPMDEKQYFEFVRELVNAETVKLHSFENTSVFEGCMPIEVMASRGDMTLAFGPLKPVGLIDERTGKKPFAVVQLRKEDRDGRAYNLVGFQTNLTFGEQKRVFSMIPGLQNAEFTRLGVMHRNSFINSPAVLDYTYMVRQKPGLFFAGQITGVEGYLESTASGLAAGIAAIQLTRGLSPIDFTSETAIGALSHYVSEYYGNDFQPQNINFGLIDPLGSKIRNKQERYLEVSKRALSVLEKIIAAF